MAKIPQKPKFADRYWICSHCADAKGWVPPKWAVTCIMGSCGYCKSGKKDVLLTPIVDFKRGKIEPVFD